MLLIQALLVVTFVASSIYLIIIDLRIRKIPNAVMYPLLLLNSSFNLLQISINASTREFFVKIGVPLFVFFLFLIIYFLFPLGLGMGDIKAILLIGLMLTRENLSLYYISLSISFIAGFIYALIIKVRHTEDPEFAFGPFLLFPAIVLSFLTL
jgi:leader peptidase (prepilin peptidase)/N-methyltransferase